MVRNKGFRCHFFVRCLQSEELDCLFTDAVEDRDLDTEASLALPEILDGLSKKHFDAIIGLDFRRPLVRASIG
jgi:hypothetical protein